MRFVYAATLLFFAVTPSTLAQHVEPVGGPPGAHLGGITATEDGLLAAGAYSGAFRYDGADWTTAPTGLRLGRLHRVGEVLFGYGGSSLIRSADGGETWEPIEFGAQAFSATADSAYVLSQDSIVVSADGVEWRPALRGRTVVDEDGEPTGAEVVSLFGLTVESGGTLWVLGFASPDFGPFRSEDGATWTSVSDGFTTFPHALYRAGEHVFVTVSQQLHRFDPALGAWSLAMDGLGETVSVRSVEAHDGTAYLNAYAPGAGLTYRLDGTTWVPVALPDPTAYVVSGGEAGLFALGTSAAYRQGEAGGWEPITEGLVASYAAPSRFGDEAVLARGLAFGAAPFVVSEDGGQTWSPLPTPEPFSAIYAFDNVHIGTAADNVYRSTDGGQTWALANDGVNVGPFHDRRFVAVAEGGGFIYAGLTSVRPIEHQGAEVLGGLYRSEDDGETWTQLASGHPLVDGLRAGVVAIAATDAEVLALTHGGLLRLAHGATQWQSVSVPGDPAFRGLMVEAGRFLYTTLEGPFLSEDGGLSWRHVGDGLPEDDIWTFHPFGAGGDLFLWHRPYGAPSRIYHLDGEGWTELGLDIPDWPVWNSVAAVGETVYVGTANHGLWEAPLGAFVVAHESGGPVAESFGLSPAYPNPTRGRAVLRLTLPAEGHVRVEVFDVQGRRVRLLHDGPLATGTEIALETAGLAPGIYVVRVRGEGVTESRRVTVLH